MTALTALALLASGGLVAGGGPVAAADQVLVRDTFARSATGSLGRASAGGAYRISGKARWSVAGSTGVSRLASAGLGQAILASARAVGSDTRFSARIADPARSRGLAIVAIARRVAAQNQYEAHAVVGVDGQLSVRILQRTGKRLRAVSALTSTGYRLSGPTKVYLRLKVAGTSPTALSFKAWPAGSAEPGWQVQTTDGARRLQRAGSIGLGVVASRTVRRFPVSVRFDDLRSVIPARTRRVTPAKDIGQGPVISRVSASDVGTTTATISWTLDQPGTGIVDYGRSGEYDEHSVKETSFRYSQHVQRLTGLRPGTTYRFRVRSADRAGDVSVSSAQTFTTAGATAATPVPTQRPAPTQAPAATQRPNPTTAPAATATPRPTATPTPRPTATPTPRPTATPVPNGDVYLVPTSVDSSGNSDASAALQTFVNGVPNGSTIRFRSGTYRMDHGLNLSNRRDLVFDGNGATLRARGSATRPLDSVFALMVGSQRLRFQDFTLIGNNPNAGTASAYGGGENLHAFYVGGASDVVITNVTVRNFYGDCVYVGTDSGTTWSQNVTFQDSTCTGTGRHGVTIIAGRNTLVQRVTFDEIGFMVVDIEPNRSMEGAIGTIIRNNTVGSYGLTNRYVSWFVAASAGAGGAVVRDLTISGNAVSGVARAGYDGTALGISVIIDGGDAPRSGIVIRDNTSTRTVARTAHGAPILIRSASDVTITGNRQPMSSGAFAQVSGSSNVTNSGNDTSR